MKHNRVLYFGLTFLIFLSLKPTYISAHFDHAEPKQSYRQSIFALLALNFGPIMSMAKGEMEWDQKLLKEYVHDLDQIANLDLSSGFTPNSKKGKTRAKLEIWENPDDFRSKISELRVATANLRLAVTNDEDKKSVMSAIRATGKSCKSCHDGYKAKDYIY